MKKKTKLIALAVLVAATIGVYSCSKEEVNTSSTQTENIDGSILRNEQVHAIRMAMTNMPANVQKQVFNQKSPETKAAIWQDKFESALELTWSTTQAKLINDIYERIIPEIYVNGSVEQIDFRTNFEPMITAQLKLAFDETTAVNLVGWIDDIGEIQKPDKGNGADCECSSSSDWCWFSDCSTAPDCNGSASGCGFAWAWDCNGICQ